MTKREESKKLLNEAMAIKDELIKELNGLQLVQTQDGKRIDKLFKKLKLKSLDWMIHNGIEEEIK